LVLGQFKSYTFDFQNMTFSAEGDSCKPVALPQP
jgi:hypothetical protein